MKIRMLVQMPAGARRNGQPWPDKGKTTDLPTADAAHLVAAGVAEEAITKRRRPPRDEG